MRRFRTLKVPENVHPLVRQLFRQMNRERIGIYDLCDRTGIGTSTMKHWAKNCSPSLVNIEACFNALGMEIVVRQRPE